MKKILYTLLTLCMVISLLSLHSSASEMANETSGTLGENLTWEFTSWNKELVISGTGEIPQEETYPWSSLQDKVQILTLKYGVTSIPPYAFAKYESLKKIALPPSLVTIGEGAFSNCTALTFARIPNSVTSLGAYAFSSCSNLMNTLIGRNVTVIPDEVFSNTGLISIEFPITVTQISETALENCQQLEFCIVMNPDCVISSNMLPRISDGPVCVKGHYGSTAHKMVSDLGATSNKYTFKALCWCSYAGEYFTITHEYCYNYRRTYYCSECLIETTYSFGGDYGHEIVPLSYTPATCIRPGRSEGICTWCDREEIDIYSATGHIIENGACTVCGVSAVTSGTYGETLTWEFREDTGTLIISGTGEMAEDSVYPWDYHYSEITSLVIEEGITSIAPYAFYDSWIKTVRLPGTLRSIGVSAFEGSPLTSVRIPHSVTELGAKAFYDTYLSEIVFGNGITRIEGSTFSSSALDEVFLPPAVARISYGAFGDCPDLFKYTIMNSSCYIPEDALLNPNWGGISIVGHRGSSAESYVKEANFWANDPAKYSFRSLCNCAESTDYTVAYPDCEAGGDVVYLCNKCGTQKVVYTIRAYGHQYAVKEDIPATCTLPGVLKKECTWCGAENNIDIAPTGHSFTDGVCICGLPNPAVIEAEWEIRHTLDLADGIALNYLVKADQIPEYEELFLHCAIPVYGDSNEMIGTKAVRLEPKDRDDTYYYFALTELTAVNMGDEIQSTLFVKKNGAYIASETDIYSIAQYAYNQLSANRNPALSALCADLLRYGAMAQTFKGYRTDALADRNMTDAQKRFLTNPDRVTFRNNDYILEDHTDPTVSWTGKALVLDSKAAVRFIINTSEFAGDPKELTLHISYTNYKGEAKTVILDNITTYPSGEGAYAFIFDGLAASELRSTLILSVFHGEKQVSDRLIYSADTYGNGKTGDLGTLCRALFAYSDSAKAWFQR